MKDNLSYGIVLLAVFPLLSLSALAADITGTVHNKTSGRPSPGDAVALVDVQAGMADVTTATTDSQGRYSLKAPANGPYLIRVEHQGAPYFVAAPQGGAPADVNVYDAAAKVEGVAIDADMLLIEASTGTLRVQERYLVRNTSSPERTQFSPENNFEVVIPSDAILDGAFATRPGGLGTTAHLATLRAKGHYSFNVPIQPDQGEKETLFEIQYHMPYSGKYSFAPQVPMRADNLVVYLPRSMKFSGASGFQSSPENPALQTYIQKNVDPSQKLSFSVQGEGQVPRDQQSGGSPASAGMETATATGPGGGIGPPIGTPDSLSAYKGWILAGLAVVLGAGAMIFLRRRQPLLATATDHAVPGHGADDGALTPPPRPAARAGVSAPPSSGLGGSVSKTALQNMVKEELFALETERLTGAISEAEYSQVKVGLQALLKRSLRGA